MNYIISIIFLNILFIIINYIYIQYFILKNYKTNFFCEYTIKKLKIKSKN